MIDQVVLEDTLQKINGSLNKRFEKDADLYISKQDEFEIKKLLCNKKFEAIVNMSIGKDIKPEIILKVIVRNAGLLSVSNIGAFERDLKPIFSKVNYRSVYYMMEDVLNDTVYVDKDVKHLLFKYYIHNMAYRDCIVYWDEENYSLDTRERSDLLYAIIHNNQPDSPNIKDKWEFIINALDEYKYLLKDNEVLVELKKSLKPTDVADTQFIFIQICMEMKSVSINDPLYENIVVSTYSSFGDVAFKDALNGLKEGHRSFKLYVKAVAELLRSCKDINVASSRFDEFYKLYQQGLLERHIKSEVDRKIWKAASKNAELYNARKTQIDNYIPKDEQIQYSSFTEVFADVMDYGKKPSQIAFVWVNMKPDALKQSLIDSYDNLDWSYEDEMEEVYEWLFRHNQKRNSAYLKRICETVASSLLEYKDLSGTYSSLIDKILLKNILEYNVKGKPVKDYMCTYHFDEYQNEYIE